MKGRTLLVLTSLAALAVAAPGTAAAKQGGTDRPLQGTVSSTDTTDLSTGAGSGQGTAVISHLGRSTFSHSYTIVPTGPNTVSIPAGADTFTAANGDKVYATFTGSGTLTGFEVGATARFTGVFTITGGTGRFNDASGTLTGSFDAEVTSLVGATLVSRNAFTVQGRISY
jgi:hypothetical protein